MSTVSMDNNRRILVVDDNQAIHGAFRKILTGKGSGAPALEKVEAALFGDVTDIRDSTGFEVDSAYQGQEGWDRLRHAIRANRPYAMAFVDERMPPGWDGVETIARLWQEDPHLQVVLCTAHSDYSWEETIGELGLNDRLLILKKPFDSVEVRQLASALTHKWDLARRARLKLEELECIVQARTRQIKRANEELRAMNEELAGAKHAAESANRAKSKFLANMSHEIRTAMTVILGFVDILLEEGYLDGAPPQTVEAAQTIKRNAEHLLQVLNDVLDISKIEAGTFEIESGPCSPTRLVSEVESLMRPRAHAAGLSFNTEYVGSVPKTIVTDPTRLRQILANLIGNAIKFTEVGGVRLVTRFVDDADGPRMQFDVMDTGLGLTGRQIVRLFQPFMQADTPATRTGGVTDLGLSISKRLARMLGGDVTVIETQAGLGTRFRLAVATGPVDHGEMTEYPKTGGVVGPAKAQPGAGADTLQLHESRILLAEDSPDNQRLILHLLENAGADVSIAENGEVAVAMALEAQDQGHPFAIILMDMQMPVMEGYAATALLRRRGYTGPIIALTAHAMAGDRQKCLDAGCDDYAMKPVHRAGLIRQIADWARTERQRGNPQAAGETSR